MTVKSHHLTIIETLCHKYGNTVHIHSKYVLPKSRMLINALKINCLLSSLIERNEVPLKFYLVEG